MCSQRNTVGETWKSVKKKKTLKYWGLYLTRKDYQEIFYEK